MVTIINRKMDFFDEKLHFSFKKVKSTLQVVNTHTFHPLFNVFFSTKIRFLKYWENAAKKMLVFGDLKFPTYGVFDVHFNKKK